MNKNLLFAVVALASPLCGHAQLQPTFTEWHDCAVNEVNRFPLHTDFFAFESADKALKGEKEHSNNYLSLEGDWKFNWVANADERPTDFYQPAFNDASWGRMSVPGCWEVND